MADTDDWADEKARALLHNLRLADFYSLTEAEVLPVIASAIRDARREALEEAKSIVVRVQQSVRAFYGGGRVVAEIDRLIRALAAGGKAE